MVEVTESERIAGVFFARPKQFPDERGRFMETFRRSWIPGSREMVQSNRSDSNAGVLRGMHYHLFQADYWFVTSGRLFVALYDLRGSSKTAGSAETLEIGEGNEVGIYIPPGVAHGFMALTPVTMTYMVDQYFDGSDEFGIKHDDPALGIAWPEGEPILSDRDRTNPFLAQIPPDDRPA